MRDKVQLQKERQKREETRAMRQKIYEYIENDREIKEERAKELESAER